MLNTIQKRLDIFFIIFIIGSLIIFGITINNEYNHVLEEKQLSVKKQVEMAYSIVDYYYLLSKDGKMTTLDAKKQALETISHMRFSNIEYFWVIDKNDSIISHPLPYIKDKNLLEFKDKKGESIFQNIHNIIVSDIQQGFVEYKGPKMTSNNIDDFELKMSFVKKFPQWEWAIGDGFVITYITESVMNIFKAYGFLFGLFIIMGLFLIKKILQPVAKILPDLNNDFLKIIDGKTEFEIRHTDRNDELGKIARNLEQVREKLKTNGISNVTKSSGFFDKDYFTKI
jgi:methyl-accepting chemotaxis protein